MYPINYYIALGTNVGNYKNNFSRAVLELKKIGNIVKQANIYKSKPYGYLKQNYFYNSMVQVRSLILPMRFMKELQLIEEFESNFNITKESKERREYLLKIINKNEN